MPPKIVDTILPTTMVGSYPRPHWYKHQLLGRDVRVAFKEVHHEEAYDDATPGGDPRPRRSRASTSSPTARCRTTTTSA